MKLDTPSLVAGCALGAAGLALGVPAIGYVASTSPTVSLCVSGALLLAAAWTKLERPTTAKPTASARAEPTLADAVPARQWLREIVGGHKAGPDDMRETIRAALAYQVNVTEEGDARIHALLVALLCIRHVPGIPPGKGSDILDRLARDVARSPTDPGLWVTHDHARITLPSGNAPASLDMLTERLRSAHDCLAARHGMLASQVLGALADAREVHDVPTSAMAWVKGVDRGLWYAIDNLGRRAFHVEGMGAMAHYETERAWDSPLDTPHVDAAADPLARLAETLTPRERSMAQAA